MGFSIALRSKTAHERSQCSSSLNACKALDLDVPWRCEQGNALLQHCIAVQGLSLGQGSYIDSWLLASGGCWPLS